MDYLTSLRVFRAVVEKRNFAAAARALGLSRAAVSKHVCALEARIGTRLLQRDPRSVSCTESGERFYSQTAIVLEALERAEVEAAEACTLPRGSLRVSASPAFAARYVAPYVGEFQRTHPLLALDLHVAEQPLPMIEEGLDIALWVVPALPPSTLVARQLARCRQVVCGAPRYFAAHGRPAAPEDLAGHACLRCTATHGEWTFDAPGGPRRCVAADGPFRADSIEVVRAGALAGVGIAQLPAFAVCDDLRAGRLEPVLESWVLPDCGVHAVYPSRKHLSAKVRAFIEFFGTKYRGDAAWSDCARRDVPRGAAASCGACAPRATRARVGAASAGGA